MAFYRQAGDIPPKRHTQHRRPDGGLYAEELMGEDGFAADSSLLYHRGIPAALVDARPWELPDQTTTPNSPLLPRHLPLHDLFPGEAYKAADPVTGRRQVLGNADVRICYAVSALASPLFRDAVGDECVYVEAGTATVETVFGALAVGPGDYVILPRGTTHRWIPAADQPLRTFVIEASSHIAPPRRYLSRYGQFLEHSPYCERDLRGPAAPAPAEGSDVEVYVKHRADRPTGLGGTVHVLSRHPFDVVGWDGYVWPYTFNADDFEPRAGRFHLPPPAHQTFQGNGFVICTFAPRMLDTHSEAIKVPYAHSNVQADEVLYYVRGRFGSRRGVEESSMTLHPRGIPHGPHPGTIVASRDATRTDELAVMVDTVRPLRLTRQAMALDDPTYPLSWMD
jgi:homogentisate 1,2-dioxygenase